MWCDTVCCNQYCWSSWIQQPTSNPTATTRWPFESQLVWMAFNSTKIKSQACSSSPWYTYTEPFLKRVWITDWIFPAVVIWRSPQCVPVSPQQLWMSLKPSTLYSACLVIFTQAWPCYSTCLRSAILSSWARNRIVSARHVFGFWSLSITLVESQVWSWEESHHSQWSPTLQFSIRKLGQSSTQWLPFPGSSWQRQFWEGQSHPKCSWHVQALIINPKHTTVFMELPLKKVIAAFFLAIEFASRN